MPWPVEISDEFYQPRGKRDRDGRLPDPEIRENQNFPLGWCFRHGDHQGVVEAIDESFVIVRYFSWLDGMPSHHVSIIAHDATTSWEGWQFYRTDAELREAPLGY